MDVQLGAVRQEIGSVKAEIVKTKQDVAAAKEARDGGLERHYLQLVLTLNKQLSGLQDQLGGLQEEKNILLRGQASGKFCLELACAVRAP